VGTRRYTVTVYINACCLWPARYLVADSYYCIDVLDIHYHMLALFIIRGNDQFMLSHIANMCETVRDKGTWVKIAYNLHTAVNELRAEIVRVCVMNSFIPTDNI